MNLHGLCSVGVSILPIYARKQANHNRSLMVRQMVKVLARTTHNAEQICGQRKRDRFKC